jgi:hypothetical protein
MGNSLIKNITRTIMPLSRLECRYTVVLRNDPCLRKRNRTLRRYEKAGPPGGGGEGGPRGGIMRVPLNIDQPDKGL